MFLVIVDHHCREGMKDKAIQRIDGNGDRMSDVEGFLFRYRAEDTADGLAITTVTGWTNEASYRQWLAVKSGASNEESPYERFLNRTFQVVRQHDNMR